MPRIILSISVVAALGGCSEGLGDVKGGHYVGGEVRGLWDGANIVVRLEAGEVREDHEAVGNGSFQFKSALPPGYKYEVTVVNTPEGHTCAPDGDTDAGWVTDADISNVSIACIGPSVDVELSSAQWTWKFDATRETQTFGASIFVQDVTLTIRGATLTSATVNDRATALDAPSSPIALPMGPTLVAVALTTSTGLTKTYQLVFQRGTPALEQSAYVKASMHAQPEEDDEFGMATALEGNTLVVGAHQRHGGAVYVFIRNGTSWTQQQVLEAPNANENFGISVALSGATLVVGAPSDDCDEAGALEPGAAYVFVRNGSVWTPQFVITASNADPGDCFGASVAISGSTVVVGAPGEASGISSNANDNTAKAAGAVYVFAGSGGTWPQRAYIKDVTPEAGDLFGTSVALSGSTLVVGAPGEDRNTGAAHVFVGAGATWTLQRVLEASNPGDGDDFGSSVALSGDTLAVGAPDESSATTGINGREDEGSVTDSGAVYVFVREGSSWAQTTYIKASNTGESDNFGSSVALSGDVLAVGAPDEKSAAKGFDGDGSDNTITEAGAVYVFQRISGAWRQQVYVKASNTGQDRFGNSLALSGSFLVVGAHHEDSGNGNPEDDSAEDAGAVYVFR